MIKLYATLGLHVGASGELSIGATDDGGNFYMLPIGDVEARNLASMILAVLE